MSTICDWLPLTLHQSREETVNSIMQGVPKKVCTPHFCPYLTTQLVYDLHTRNIMSMNILHTSQQKKNQEPNYKNTTILQTSSSCDVADICTIYSCSHVYGVLTMLCMVVRRLATSYENAQPSYDCNRVQIFVRPYDSRTVSYYSSIRLSTCLWLSYLRHKPIFSSMITTLRW